MSNAMQVASGNLSRLQKLQRHYWTYLSRDIVEESIWNFILSVTQNLNKNFYLFISSLVGSKYQDICCNATEKLSSFSYKLWSNPTLSNNVTWSLHETISMFPHFCIKHKGTGEKATIFQKIVSFKKEFVPTIGKMQL